MPEIIVATDQFLTLLGGSRTHFSHIKQAVSEAPILTAADGGADTALANNLSPEAVIGDFDSISPETLEKIPPERCHHIAEQDSTDFEKCISRIEAPLIIAVGFSGARLDHQLAVLTVMAKYPDKTVILLGEDDLCFLVPERLKLDLPTGCRFSIFPFAPVKGESTGLKYPINGLTLSPLGMVGTSNEVEGPVDLRLPGRTSFVLLPPKQLKAAIAALVKAV